VTWPDDEPQVRRLSVAGHHPVGPAIGELRALTELECRVHVELPVHALLPGPKAGGRLRHWDYLWLVDVVRVAVGHNGRRAFVEDVLQPIGALTVREGDQEAVVVLDRDDRCLVCPARSPPDMADDRRVGSFLAGRPQSERPHGSSEPPQRVLDRTSRAPRSQRVGGGSRAERPSYLLPGASCPTGPVSLPARAAAPVQPLRASAPRRARRRPPRRAPRSL